MDVGAMSVTVDDACHGTDQEIPVLHDHVTSKVEQSFQGSLHHAPCAMRGIQCMVEQGRLVTRNLFDV